MNNMLTPKTALQNAIQIAGSQNAIARICGVTQPSVSGWLQRGFCAPGAAILIENATGVNRAQLAPNIYPKEDAA